MTFGRNLVYATRSFERFRREFFVDIAVDYFNLMAQAVEEPAAVLGAVSCDVLPEAGIMQTSRTKQTQ